MSEDPPRISEPSSRERPATRILARDGRPVARRIRRFRLHVETPGHADRVVELASPRASIGSRPGLEVVIDDPSVSRLHAELTLDEHGFRLRDAGSTNGTWVDGYRTADIHLRDGSVIALGQSTLRFEPLDDEEDVPLSRGDAFGRVIGRSVAMRELFAVLERTAPTDVTILIEGESGTGKELIAEAVHAASRRASGPFVVFDCGSVPSSLIESELFGHERGAFTGAAARRVGRFEEADGGTLFLDEIGELPLDLQPRLLRALEKREVRRVGGTKPIALDVRIVAATHRDLVRMTNAGTFREDLFYRLAVVSVRVPRLADRREDVQPLVEHFVKSACRDEPRRAERVLAGVTPESWRKLQTHSWPGNVRELRNVIERTLALSDGRGADAFEPATRAAGERLEQGASSPSVPAVQSSGPVTPSGQTQDVDLDRPFVDGKAEALARFEAAYLEGMLARHSGNISRAAAAAGLDRMYFKRLLRKVRGEE
ncbi:MAG: sigma 54-dependent Fis family transcriptional regulator [Deltaproteobacteria bacterium]|nr:sigma 54-dependent Fis family transcriptional regulator [Deltaproteobacteria bacterium]